MLTLEMVRSAQSRIAPYVRRTRLERNSTLSDRFGTSIYLKLELFQKTGSFKSRGAINQSSSWAKRSAGAESSA